MSSKRLVVLEKMTGSGSTDPFAWYGLAMEYKSLARVELHPAPPVQSTASVWRPASTKIGANGNLDTSTAMSPVVAFVLTNAGLMAGISLEGTKVSRLVI